MCIYLPGWKKSTLKGEINSKIVTSYFTSFGFYECEIVTS